MAMLQHRPSQNPPAQQQETRGPNETIKLIRKLRWIGLESEAKELQHVLEGLPPARRGSVVAAPHSTD